MHEEANRIRIQREAAIALEIVAEKSYREQQEAQLREKERKAEEETKEMWEGFRRVQEYLNERKKGEQG